MTTSLQQQLERLAVPATTALAIDAQTTKASILFSKKEAGTKDRRTIYELGVTGLQELIVSCPAFQQFGDTLFNEETINLERSVENREVNDILDANIKKFLIYLQPYLMVRPAHLCVEWLLRRFHIHLYNTSDLIALILPYHETNIFVLVLQTMKLRLDVHWSWLRPLQKPGLPLPKSTLYNRAASNADFMRFVCSTTEAAVAELSAKHSKLLQTQLNFYASVVVGALEVADLKEWHITTILPSMLHGIVSSTEDYVAAAYIVAAQLVTRTKLTAKICNVLLKRVRTMPFERLRPSAVLLMICIFEKQHEAKPEFTKKTLHQLMQTPWLLILIGRFIKDNISVQALCVAMLRTAVQVIHAKEPEAGEFKKFLNDLVATLAASENTLEHFISAFLESYVADAIEETQENHQQAVKVEAMDVDMEDDYWADPAVDKNDDEEISVKKEEEEEEQDDSDDESSVESDAESDGSTEESYEAQNESDTEVIVLEDSDGEHEDDTKAVQNNAANTKTEYLANTSTEDLASNLDQFDLNDEYDAWYSKFLKHLEDVSPISFDRVVKEAAVLSVNVASQRNKALKFATAHRLKYIGLDATNLYKSLYHPSADMRKLAVEALVDKIEEYSSQPSCREMIKDSIIDRLQDSMEIVCEIYKMKTSKLLELIGYEKLLDSLLSNLCDSLKSDLNLDSFLEQTLQHLMAKDVLAHEKCNPCLILIAVMPVFILPAKFLPSCKRKLMKIVCDSKLPDKWKFLNELANADERKINLSTHASQQNFQKCIQKQPEYAPKVSELLITLRSLSEGEGAALFKQPNYFDCFLVLLSSAIIEINSATKYTILELLGKLCECSKKYKLRSKNFKHQEYISLYMLSDCLELLLEKVIFDNINCWESKSQELSCFFKIFAFLITKYCDPKFVALKPQLGNTVQTLFQTVFKDKQEKLIFLINFCIFEKLDFVADYEVLRLMGLKLLQHVISDKDNEVSINISEILKIIVGLGDESEIFRNEILNVLFASNERSDLDATVKSFVERICAHKCEIVMDHEQLPVILAEVLRKDNKGKRKFSSAVLRESLKIVCDTSAQQTKLKVQLLKALQDYNDVKTVSALIPAAKSALSNSRMEGVIKMLSPPHDLMLNLILQRFNVDIIHDLLVEEPQSWTLIKEICSNHDVFFNTKRKLEPLPCTVVRAFSSDIYAAMPSKYQMLLIKEFVATIVTSENDAIFLAVNKLLKKCNLDCKCLAPLFEEIFMTDVPKSTNATKRQRLNSVSAQNQPNWKQGVALLELLENKSNLLNTAVLIPIFFQMLKICQAAAEAEEVYAEEYTKHLILSALLHCFQKAEADAVDIQNSLEEPAHRISDVVKSMRSSQNPQTQQSALSLLAYLAVPFPHHVLQNMVGIFTFMGSTVSRHDDDFSFGIIENIITALVPVLVQHAANDAQNNSQGINPLVIPVLKVFSDIMPDVPQHRRTALYAKLLTTLDAGQNLWAFICVLLESLVMEDEKVRLLQKKPIHDKKQSVVHNKHVNRFEFAIELTNTFSATVIIKTFVGLLEYLRNLPDDVSDEKDAQKSHKSNGIGAELTEAALFDVNCHSARQLRHFKFVITQLLLAISCGDELVSKLKLLTTEDLEEINPLLRNFILKTMAYISYISPTLTNANAAPIEKYLKVISRHMHEILDKAISLLTPSMFANVVGMLICYELPSISKKVIEVVIHKVQKDDLCANITNDEAKKYLLKPLRKVLKSLLERNAPKIVAEGEESSAQIHTHIYSNALVALRILSRHYATIHVEFFKDRISDLTTVLKQQTNLPKILLGNIVLTTIEIACDLKAQCLPFLPKFMPHCIEQLKQQAEYVRQRAPEPMLLWVIAATHKLFEAMPLFLSPYCFNIITSVCELHTYISAQPQLKDKGEKDHRVLFKINSLVSKIASATPIHIIVSNCERCFDEFMTQKNYSCIPVLMKLVGEVLSSSSNEDIFKMQRELNVFFQQSLKFRLNYDPEALKNPSAIEASIFDAFVSWVLKLSESSFRPVYHEVFEWTLKQQRSKEGALIYFSLSGRIAEVLKALFVLFAPELIDDAVEFLNKTNSDKVEIASTEETINIELIKAILSTLHQVFLHESKNYITDRRFEILLPALVDQFQNRLIQENEELQILLKSCIAQLAVAVSADVQWKKLNQQVLLKTRIPTPEVRTTAFSCCVEIATKLGEDFTLLLPETVPFIAEMLEDENPRVEKTIRQLVQQLEGILGESIQKYL